MSLFKLYDTFGRSHDYLRISLTDSCNLRCMYCIPNEKLKVTPSKKMMQDDEVVGIAEKFISLGVKKIRLTGGEPLVRKNIGSLIMNLSQLPVELTLSTNGLLIDEYLNVLKQSTIRSVNVSLDTLNAEEFKTITKRGDFEKIVENIYLLLSNNFKVKVNMVVMKGVNEHAVKDFVRWTKDFQLDVRFIEFMPFAGNKWELNKVYSYTDMLDSISSEFKFEKLKDGPHDTSKKYKSLGHKGTFAFITTVTDPFCGYCNRLRLTADGKMKNCLFSQNETDLLTAWRNGIELEPLIIENLLKKKQKLGGLFDFSNSDQKEYLQKSDLNRSMIKIGG